MSTDPITQNAQSMENTRIDGPPVEPSPAAMERIAALRSDPEYYNNGSERQRALVKELRGLLTTTGAPPKEDPEEHAVEISLDEQRRRDLSRDPAYLAGGPAKVAEMRQILARLEKSDPVDAERRAQMSLSERREEFGLRTDDLLRTQWAKDAWSPEDEGTFLDLAHEQGWEPGLVRDLVADYGRSVQGSMGQVTDCPRTSASCW